MMSDPNWIWNGRARTKTHTHTEATSRFLLYRVTLGLSHTAHTLWYHATPISGNNYETCPLSITDNLLMSQIFHLVPLHWPHIIQARCAHIDRRSKSSGDEERHRKCVCETQATLALAGFQFESQFDVVIVTPHIYQTIRTNRWNMKRSVPIWM